MDSIGEKISQIRVEKGLSRAALCDSESVLSARQLARIESGESSPSASTIQYIAECLGIPSYQLMPDYQELPAAYKELKYLVLRQPAYGETTLLTDQKNYLEMIFERFYKDLPAEEQFVMSCLQEINEMHLTGDIRHAKDLIDQQIDTFLQKPYYTLNDLPFFRLLSGFFHINKANGHYNSPKYLFVFEGAFVKLLKQAHLFSFNHLFIYANSIITGLSYYNLENNYSHFPEGIELLRTILDKTQDFQKLPLVLMLEWKKSLFIDGNLEEAMLQQEEAKQLAQLFRTEAMEKGLREEWKEDLEKFFKK